MVEINMEPIPNGFGGGAEKPPENRPTPEITPELVRSMDTTRLYTVPGGLRIIEFREALQRGEVSKIRESLEKGLAWIEGVTNGIDAKNYGLTEFKKGNDDREIVDLKNMFESVETSIDRPESGYLRMAIEDGLERTIETATLYKNMDEEQRKNYWDNLSQSRLVYYIGQNGYFQENGRSDLVVSPEDISKKIQEEVRSGQESMERLTASLKDLKGLRHHYDARVKVFEPLFKFTQQTCEDEDDWFKYSKSSPKPDKGHWIGVYQSNRLESAGEGESSWGRAVDATENAIEKVRWGEIKLKDSDGNEISDGYDIYTNGFRTTGEFVAWARAILPYTVINNNGVQRIDVLFAAWRQATLKGAVSRLAWGVKTKKDGDGNETRDENGRPVYEYAFGNPPIATDIRTHLIHNEKSRAKEWGWCANNTQGQIVDLDEWVLRDVTGKVIRGMAENDFQEYIKYAENHRTKPYRAVSHSGHPISIGRIGRLVDAYEFRTKVNKRSLHDISYTDGISRSNPNFPWSDTEIMTGREAPGEPPSGSWGTYHLETVRGYKVRNTHIRTIPEPGNLRIQFFEDSSVRSWEKIGKLRPGQLKNGIPDNPFAWYLAGVLYYRSLYPSQKKGDLDYRSGERAGKTNNIREGASDSNAVSSFGVLSDATKSGAISKEESEWIQKNYLGSKMG